MNEPNVYQARVSAAILRSGREVLVARESRLGAERVNLPGGAPQPGETLERALIREVREETGLDVVPTEIAAIVETKSDRWSSSSLEICFYAEIASSPTHPPQRGEHIKSLDWRRLDDPDVVAEIPHVRLFQDRERGRYVDRTVPGPSPARS